jgi:hypothetical protein
LRKSARLGTTNGWHALHGIAHVPISDLPPSETAIVWLSTNRSEISRAFAQAAADVLGPRDQ